MIKVNSYNLCLIYLQRYKAWHHITFQLLYIYICFRRSWYDKYVWVWQVWWMCTKLLKFPFHGSVALIETWHLSLTVMRSSTHRIVRIEVQRYASCFRAEHIWMMDVQLLWCYALTGSVQERHYSSASAMELHLSCTNPWLTYLLLVPHICVSELGHQWSTNNFKYGNIQGQSIVHTSICDITLLKNCMGCSNLFVLGGLGKLL